MSKFQPGDITKHSYYNEYIIIVDDDDPLHYELMDLRDGKFFVWVKDILDQHYYKVA